MYAIALLLVIVLIALLWWARRSIFGWMGNAEDVSGPGFTLADLRQLHKSGKMTDEEYERAKAQVVQGIQAAAARKPAEPQKSARSGQAGPIRPDARPPQQGPHDPSPG